jgi:hypothetical protein
MNQEQITKLELSIENMKNKKSRIYLITQDTKGNAKASIAYIYRLGLALLNEGYNPIILHETPEYTGVSGWLGDEYMKLPHKTIEGQNLEVSPEDLIVIPELYGFVMSQITNLPCGKIVLCQAYDHMLETLPPGVSWTQYGFFKVITTTEKQKLYHSYSNVLTTEKGADEMLPYVPKMTDSMNTMLNKVDNVNSSSHYTYGKIECIDYIEDKGFCFHIANAIKYLWRWKQKNGVEDLNKARFYIDKLINELQK